MNTEITLYHRETTPMIIIVATLLLGLSSPLVSAGFVCLAMYHAAQTHDTVQVMVGACMAVIWPVGWIVAMLLGALHPLFGKTHIVVTPTCVCISKYLFSWCRKKYEFPNDGSVYFTVAACTHQCPAASSANQMGRGTTTSTEYHLLAVVRPTKRRIVLYSCYDEAKVKNLAEKLSNCTVAS